MGELAVWQGCKKCRPCDNASCSGARWRDSQAIRDGNNWAVPWEIFPAGWYQTCESLTEGECRCCSLLLTPA